MIAPPPQHAGRKAALLTAPCNAYSPVQLSKTPASAHTCPPSQARQPRAPGAPDPTGLADVVVVPVTANDCSWARREPLHKGSTFLVQKPIAARPAQQAVKAAQSAQSAALDTAVASPHRAKPSRRLTVTLGWVVVPGHKECLSPIAPRGIMNAANNLWLLAPCEGVYFADGDCCQTAADVEHCKVQVLAACMQKSQPSRPAAGWPEPSCSSVQRCGCVRQGCKLLWRD